jgi:hypothetical protein
MTSPRTDAYSADHSNWWRKGSDGTGLDTKDGLGVHLSIVGGAVDDRPAMIEGAFIDHFMKYVGMKECMRLERLGLTPTRFMEIPDLRMPMMRRFRTFALDEDENLMVVDCEGLVYWADYCAVGVIP